MYQFPPTKFTGNTLWRQWWHLLSEVIEVGFALWRGNIQHAAAEAWDIKHSTETFHRILEMKGANIRIAMQVVTENNLRRRYYDPR